MAACDPQGSEFSWAMRVSHLPAFCFRLFSVAVASGAIFLTSTIGRAAPPKSKPVAPPSTEAANSDDDDEAADPSKIVIPGTVLTRPGDKGYLSLTLEGGVLNLSFYNKNKQAIAPDVARAAVHWRPKQTHGEESGVLNLSAGSHSLKGNRFIQPPFPIQMFITLLNEQDVGVENYSLMFRP